MSNAEDRLLHENLLLKQQVKEWQYHAAKFEDFYNEIVHNKVALLRALSSVKDQKSTPASILRAIDLEKGNYSPNGCFHELSKSSHMENGDIVIECPHCGMYYVTNITLV